MSGYYPPGVTGNEPEIQGDSERERLYEALGDFSNDQIAAWIESPNALRLGKRELFAAMAPHDEIAASIPYREGGYSAKDYLLVRAKARVEWADALIAALATKEAK